MPKNNIPEQVRKQGEESDRLIEEANNPTLEPVVNDKPNEPAKKIDPEDYKERFVNFKKNTDETINSLRMELSQLTGQNNAQTDQIADLIQRLEAKTVEAPIAPAVNSNESLQERIAGALTDDEKGQYEEGFIEMIARMIDSVHKTQNVAPDTNLESRLENVEKKQVLSDGEKFWHEINIAVPNWRELQKLDNFQAYLSKFDPLLMSTRADILNQAQSDLNHERAIAVFTNYTNGTQNHIVEDDPIIDPLEKHVAPEVTGSGDGSGIEDVPVLSTEEISQFYVDVAVGKYKTRPSEQASMENAIQQIHAALNHSQAPSVENKTEY